MASLQKQRGLQPREYQTATDTIPFIYRFILTTVEPIFAVAGVITTYNQPSTYLSTMTRSATLPAFQPETSFLYTQLCGAWLMFAFQEAVVLRLVDDARVWILLCCGMLLSDVCYSHSCAQAVGGWARWVVLSEWTAADWVVLVTTLPPVLCRVLLVLGVGVGRKVDGRSKKDD